MINIMELVLYEEQITRAQANIKAIEKNLLDKTEIMHQEQQHLLRRVKDRRIMERLKERQDIAAKLQRLKQSPRTEIGAHPLHGRLAGKWSCWLGSNIRMIYSIDDFNKRIIVEAVGTHNIY